ncbi:hypothetical protein F8388_012732 [Cannabis sativa]|uniref:Uncharacterized protein n=1 Tax=Cannabis sativa TaxID=3483 RepID=A0A7J6HAE2_CANSA|nr:hypothetical protein G4B88_028509 [Cannabis sativa]KAF4392276.1 hypothetical protein F8388_012732 [Cannabis sativa]
MNLESRMIAFEDIGNLKKVDEITLKDITNIAQKIISSPLTMASYGDVINVPSYESLSCKFNSR